MSTPSSVAVPAEGPSAGALLRRLRPTTEMTILLGMLALLILVSAITTEGFFNSENARAIVRSAALTGIVAIGLTFVTLSGNLLSLSLEQTAAICGVLLAMMLHDGWAAGLALLVILGVAIVLGVVQGGVVALGANPIIVTLGAGAALAGLTGVISGGTGITTGPTSIGWLGTAKVFGFTMPTYVFIAVAVLAAIFLARARAGRALMLVGSNRDAAAASGLSVSRTTMLAFVLTAVGCALAATITVAQFQRADTIQFEGLTFDALAAILVGGAAIGGGEGSPARTAIGAVFIATLGDFMVLHNYSFGLRMTVQGVVVLVAVTAFHLIRRRRTGR
ncbi:MAG: ABC transporter permease [Actinobacteria bacterium]|nr:ABC transporter permease [Actinomycetota bacterium]